MAAPARERPAIGLEIADSGTRLSAMLAGDTPVRRHLRLAAPPSPDEALAAIESLIARLYEEAAIDRPASLGVAVWGRVAPATGAVLELPLNAAWTHVPFGAHLADRLGIPVRVVGAVEAAALAEWPAVGATADTVLYCHAGRSAASCLVRDGAAVRGATGRDGQLGHLRVRGIEARCSCGQIGHLDTIGSAQSLVRTFIGRASATDESLAALHRASGGRPEAISVSQIAALAGEGEPAAIAVFDAAAAAWAEALATAQVLYDADTVIIGGALAGAGVAFLVRVAERMRDSLPRVAVPPRLAFAAHAPDGALVGACLLAESARA